MPELPELKIDQMTLRITGISESEGQRLARLVAEGLAERPLNGGGNRARVQSSQTAAKGTSTENLARSIVEDLLRQLNRTV